MSVDTGHATASRKHYSTTEERFAARSSPSGGCTVWTGAKNQFGYGQIWTGERLVPAHRYAWERTNGPIPDGMVIDHLCWNRACVNVEHLRVVAQAQNNQNLSGARSDSKSGVRGVRRHGNGWEARVQTGGVKYSSKHPTLEDAEAWVTAMRTKLMPFSQEQGRKLS